MRVIASVLDFQLYAVLNLPDGNIMVLFIKNFKVCSKFLYFIPFLAYLVLIIVVLPFMGDSGLCHFFARPY